MTARAPVFLMLLVLAGTAALAQDPELAQVKERELEKVREKISALKTSMDRRAAERDRVTAELQDAEVGIAEKRAHLKDLERQHAYSESRKAEIGKKLEAERAALADESERLGQQVATAYMSGEQERLKLLLNQRDPATLGRLMTYYRYMSEYRGANIETVNAHIDELQSLGAEAAREEARLRDLTGAMQAEVRSLDDAQAGRQALLADLRARIADEGSEIERLAAEERDLARLIAELTSILSDYPITSEAPFSELRGRLTWPVAGTLVHDFGQPRAGGGGVKWNGVVLAAPRGREVRAVYHGRVIFADWLAGMGLLVIVDHGEGYMTLYGYNETTLKSAGDWVAPGDVIATVGDSGGQSRSALYFEIRRGKEPVDPRRWVSRKPKTG